ncbi:FAD-dependent monooxygenase [Colletotrichum sp. SAR 10_98]|nr:FAD-dependent monooxygenase [Colletotrichum sp. SAR 10_98]
MTDEEVDVLICGSGSAGLCAAVWLARCGVKFKILERREGPLQQGQADGVQCRTVEIMESLGLSEDLLKEAYHVLELAFWTPDGNGGIRRSHLEPDTEPGLSWLPHVILNQARINEFMIKDIERVSGQSHIQYFKGCDGAHSSVRKSLGFKMVGDSTDAVWAVMDVFAKTDFPDIRKKCVLQSPAGNLVIIPREGDEKVRFYMEMPGWAASDVKPDKVKHRVDQIFSPYAVDIVETSWFSAYSIGQRLADNFTKDHRVFLTGDACHTHSPKAGQGMNATSELAAALERLVLERFHPVLLLKSDRKMLDERKIPSFFMPNTGHGGVRRLQDVFVDDQSYHAGHGEAYAKYGVDAAVGAVVLVRPDQYDIVKFFMDPTIPSKG